MLRIGLSPGFFHRDPKRNLFKDRTLLFLEESLAHWLLDAGALSYLIPTPSKPGILKKLVADLDGLVLQGGADVCPNTYGEEPLKPEWMGDAIRDKFEIALVKEFRRQRKPILGICRGAQLLNVALGGTLYQDIGTQLPKALVHRDWEIYEKNFHHVKFEEKTLLKKMFPKVQNARVNSIHHQGVKDLGKGLHVEARATDDGMVEAIAGTEGPFLFAFQWHPEFHKEKDLLDCRPILNEFLKACRPRKKLPAPKKRK